MNENFILNEISYFTTVASGSITPMRQRVVTVHIHGYITYILDILQLHHILEIFVSPQGYSAPKTLKSNRSGAPAALVVRQLLLTSLWYRMSGLRGCDLSAHPVHPSDRRTGRAALRPQRSSPKHARGTRGSRKLSDQVLCQGFGGEKPRIREGAKLALQ